MKRAGASASEIAFLQAWVPGVQFPRLYLDLLRDSNGYRGSLSETGYLDLWATYEIPGHNAALEVAESAPGLLLFGSTMGGSGFAFDTRSDPMPIVCIGYIDLRYKGASQVGFAFDNFMHRMIDGTVHA